MKLLRLSILGGLCFVSCMGAYKLDDAQTSIRSSMISGNYENTIKLVENLEKKKIYESKDRLLLQLDKGTIYHFASNYKESFNSFENAERTIENNYTKSISRGIKSFIVNDNMLVYDGEDYEDIYINSFKALNFIHMGDLESSLIEVRRMNYKIENLNIKHNGLTSALAEAFAKDKKEKKGEVKFEPGKAEIQSSSLAHFLATVLYTKSGKYDDAEIEFNKFKSALTNQQSFSSKPLGNTNESLDVIANNRSFNTLLVSFCGKAPVKQQRDSRIFIKEADLYIKLSLPKLQMNTSMTQRVRVTQSSGKVTYLPLIEQMDHVAKEVYKIKEPIIYARTYVRVAAKILAGKVAENEAKDKKNKELAEAFSFLTKLGTELSEKADLRGWQTMPGEVYAFVLQLEPGEQTVKIDYLGTGDVVLHSEMKTLLVSENSNLEIVETVYWN